MRPIFKPEIDFLKQQLNINIPENCCWMNKMNIYGFDKATGKRIHLYRLKCDQMKLNLKSNKYVERKLKSYQDLIEENKQQINNLEKDSIKIIMDSFEKYPLHKPHIFTSMGKDSTVLTYLVRKIRPLIPAEFNNTTLDTYHTYQLAKKQENTNILVPKVGFYQWRNESNFIPTRFGRGCCKVFKEGATKDFISEDENSLFFYGMRNSESSNRSNYEDEWENINWNTDKWIGILPIRKWDDLSLWLYIFRENLTINPMYTLGYGRVGCSVPCPFRSCYENYLDKHYFPKAFNRWQKILREDFINNFKWTVLNCTLQEYLDGAWKGGVFREEPTKEVIEEFAYYKGLDIEIAKKYFNKVCKCGKKVKKNEVGLSMKYFGRNTNQFLCMKCLSEMFGISKKELKQRINDFKFQGCDLF